MSAPDSRPMNLADVYEALARHLPDRAAVVQGDRRITWPQFDARATGIATSLVAAGLNRGDRVAQYLRNCPEYLESFIGALKASFVPFNTNYRYVDDELVHLWTDADAAAVVFHGEFAPVIERIRHRLPLVRLWLWVDDGTGGCPGWAERYEDAVAREATAPPWPRSTDDLVFIYTGGTTGLPKGVMWAQDLYLAGLGAAIDDLDAYAAHWAEATPRVALPAPPLMHSTGAATALGTMTQGGTVVLLEGRHLDPVAVWSAVEAERVGALTIVGDAFARPLADALDAEPERWDLSSLRRITSAGAMFSAPVKQRLLAHLPTISIRDQLGSSEHGNAGARVSQGSADATATFDLHPGTRVLDDDFRDVEPGSGQVGVLASPGGAVGYHKDPDKSARTWPTIDGRRYTIAGDHATVEADGTIRLLGRGSVCINTGGEKVYPEEVEEALKSHPAVDDAVVVGIPDDRFGERVAAAVELAADADDAELLAHLDGLVAGYKKPRHLVRVESIGRAPNGKADYAATRARVLEAVHGTAT